MSELEVGYRRFRDIRAAWKDRTTTAEADKVVLVEHLKQSTDREARLEGEISHLGSELKSARKEAKRKGRTTHRLRRERDGIVNILAVMKLDR